MSEKTQFTPEDVGRRFETSKEGITAKLVHWDNSTSTIWKCLFDFSDGDTRWCNVYGGAHYNAELQVFPSRPVEEAPSQPTIETEVEELARELYVYSNKVYIPDTAFYAAEEFIKFRNERRAGNGK